MQPKNLKNRQTAIKNGDAKSAPVNSNFPKRFVITKTLSRR